jgi:hypothetical protein
MKVGGVRRAYNKHSLEDKSIKSCRKAFLY